MRSLALFRPHLPTSVASSSTSEIDATCFRAFAYVSSVGKEGACVGNLLFVAGREDKTLVSVAGRPIAGWLVGC